jgi:serine/threonine protein kinase
MSTEPQRTCPSCGNELSGAMELCPVCMLRQGLAGGAESGESSASEDTVKLTTPEQAVHRFEHYELVMGEDGKPVELGRGAMGITYKAFDVDLHCQVTLKVISERYLGDESVRLRFLREARAAASVRHPNVASVFHLGRTGQNYFYAMEFVEGETLENLIKRSGKLEVRPALEIATQVAAGLAAVHKQKLVHRDIKPSNIMVALEEGGTIISKIIDLGLAKPAPDAPVEAAISTPGAFAGTPAFASPEQFAGVGVDIRSDLYSLGVVLWKMVTGHVVFSGSAAEVMHQHQHAPLPIEELKGVPQPMVTLLEVLLEKDPARRFQNPTELLKALPTLAGAIDGRRRITRESLHKGPSAASHIARRPSARLGPKKISVARLPVTGSDVFGREEDIAFLDRAWTNQDINVVTIVAWAGVGKSTLVNHWLRRMAAKRYRSAEFVFGWSFYRQGASGETSTADEFLDAALTWFGDSDPRLGTGWEKGERLAKLVAQRRTLLILDGLEPLQNPPGPQEGRLRDPALQALLRELAAFNRGLCVITTRMPVADIADHERTSALRRELEHLSSDAGAKLLQALGVKGGEADLRAASDEFGGHCLALTLLGSYLTDAFKGDIRFRKEVSDRLAHDIRQGVHAQKVMESYQKWFGKGPELAVLRILGLFDRPADEKAIATLLESPAIPGLTESLTGLSKIEWRTIIARLRRARLLASEDPNNPGQLDAHPLVREYFGEQLRAQRTGAWKESNRRLYNYYQALAPELPETFREMEPLFLAVIHGCSAGLFREALREVYIPRIQRENSSFAANILGARGTLLSVLGQFFENGWESPVVKGTEEHSLSEEDELFILLQAGQYLTATRGFGAPGVRVCYERAESLCHALNCPHFLYVSLMGQWRHLCATDRGTARLQLAQRIYSVAWKQNEVAQLIGAFSALATTNYALGDFEASYQYAIRGVELWRSEGLQSTIEEVEPGIVCLCYVALFQLHNGDITSSQATIEEMISQARELNDMHGLAVALDVAASVACDQRDLMKVELYSSELIELSTRYHFAFWMAAGVIYRGWALSAAGKSAEGILSIEQGIRDLRATGELDPAGDYLALKAEALYLADRSYEALETIKEAELLAERFESRAFDALFLRLRGVFLTAIGAEETQIESSFCEAIRVADEQKSVLLAKRAEATYAEYRRQKASAAGRRGFRLPL